MTVRISIGGVSVEVDWPVLQQGGPDQYWVLTCPDGIVRSHADREGLEEYAKLLYGNVIVLPASRPSGTKGE